MVMAPPLEQMSSMVLGFTKGEAPATPSVSRNHARARRFQNDDVRRVCIARDYGGDIGPTATFLRNGGCRSGPGDLYQRARRRLKATDGKIGRASGRGRGEISVGAVSFKK